jgi:hypothetical protein
MNNSGIVFTRPRDTISFFVGVLLFAVGLLPLLIRFGVLDWKLPEFMTSLPFSVAIWIIAVAGFYIIIDGFIEPPAHNLHWFLIVAGVVLFVVGLLPILYNFGVLGFNLGSLLSNLIVYQSLITLEGILLMIGGLTEH